MGEPGQDQAKQRKPATQGTMQHSCISLQLSTTGAVTGANRSRSFWGYAERRGAAAQQVRGLFRRRRDVSELDSGEGCLAVGTYREFTQVHGAGQRVPLGLVSQ